MYKNIHPLPLCNILIGHADPFLKLPMCRKGDMVFQWHLLQRSRQTQACTRTYQATKQTCILVRQTLNPPTEILTTYSDRRLQRKKQKKIKIKNSTARIKKRQQQNNSSLEEKEKKDKTKHATTNNSSSSIFYVCAVHTQVLAFMATASCCSCSSCSKQPEVPKMTMRRMQLYTYTRISDYRMTSNTRSVRVCKWVLQSFFFRIFVCAWTWVQVLCV